MIFLRRNQTIIIIKHFNGKLNITIIKRERKYLLPDNKRETKQKNVLKVSFFFLFKKKDFSDCFSLVMLCLKQRSCFFNPLKKNLLILQIKENVQGE